MRLIDADALMKKSVVINGHRVVSYLDVIEQPTAYDVESKVAELENFEMWKELLIYDLSHREREIIKKAISIVRGKE